MNKPHKHAEVLRAIADGKEVQFKDGNGVWVTPFDANPIMQSSWEWRVKPQPKPDYFLYIGYEDSLYSWDGAGVETADAGNKKHILKITIDGETHKYKSTEVLK